MDYLLGPKTLCEITERDAIDFEASRERWTRRNILGSIVAITTTAVGGVISYFSSESSIADRFVEAGLMGLVAAGISTIINISTRVERQDGKYYLRTLVN